MHCGPTDASGALATSVVTVLAASASFSASFFADANTLFNSSKGISSLSVYSANKTGNFYQRKILIS